MDPATVSASGYILGTESGGFGIRTTLLLFMGSLYYLFTLVSLTFKYIYVSSL